MCGRIGDTRSATLLVVGDAVCLYLLDVDDVVVGSMTVVLHRGVFGLDLNVLGVNLRLGHHVLVIGQLEGIVSSRHVL